MLDAADPLLKRLVDAARGASGLDVLLLFGSRARGDAHAASDWDFAYIAGPEFDVAGLLTTLVLELGTDDVDLVDLRRAGGLLRYRAARDGVTLFERTPGLADTFRIEAVLFWCEAGPLLERAFEGVLRELRP